MRPNEERAQQKFTVLLGALTESPGTWRDGEDPPDFWLEWGGERFAVEVTEVMQSIPLGSGSLSERGLLAGLKSTVSGLETEILADGLLTGTFVLHACPVPDLRSQITALKAAAENFKIDVALFV